LVRIEADIDRLGSDGPGKNFGRIFKKFEVLNLDVSDDFDFAFRGEFGGIDPLNKGHTVVHRGVTIPEPPIAGMGDRHVAGLRRAGFIEDDHGRGDAREINLPPIGIVLLGHGNARPT